MKRGDIISVSLPRNYGKPRPALVVQSDIFRHLDSVTVLPLTSETLDAGDCRVSLEPTQANGLRETSHVMIDKTSSVPKVKTGPVIGHVSPSDMAAVNRSLALFLGFG